MPRILIIDDEIENLESLKRALGDVNPAWEISTAKNDTEGIAIVKQAIEAKHPIDAVLTDLVLESEESGGMNVLQECRKLDPNIMTILFTAKERNLDRYAAFDYGAFDVVEKNILGTAAHREINIKTRAALRYREWSKQVNFLQRYFDPKVFATVQKDPSLLDIAYKIITIVFWDIRGFSRLCESLKAHPPLISGFLKEYCEMGAQTIFKNNGVLDKFIGDGIMALFGVLNHRDDAGKQDAISAVKAAIDMLKGFKSILDKWIEEWKMYVPDKIEIGLGCGIHTGEVLVGNVGTDFRDQFTALGPHVNFASRIESISKANEILITQSTEVRVKSKYPVSNTCEISDIKNIPGKFMIYRIETST